MRSGGGVVAAVVVAAMLSVMAMPSLAGGDGPGHVQRHYLLFANFDLWRHGGFAHGGVLWSPKGLDRQGPLLKLVLGGGSYRYISGALGNADVQGRLYSAAVLPGWRFILERVYLTLFAGYDFQSHRLSPDDPSAGLRGNHSGVRAAFELWYEPTPTTMVTADGFVSTVGTSYSARIAAGWRLFGLLYLGPEAQAFSANGNYRQARAGLHGSAYRTGEFEWSASLGWAQDNDDRSGLYVKLGVFARR